MILAVSVIAILSGLIGAGIGFVIGYRNAINEAKLVAQEQAQEAINRITADAVAQAKRAASAEEALSLLERSKQSS